MNSFIQNEMNTYSLSVISGAKRIIALFNQELMDILNEMKNTEGNALIFCATKSTVKDLQYNLSKRERVR